MEIKDQVLSDTLALIRRIPKAKYALRTPFIQAAKTYMQLSNVSMDEQISFTKIVEGKLPAGVRKAIANNTAFILGADKRSAARKKNGCEELDCIEGKPVDKSLVQLAVKQSIPQPEAVVAEVPAKMTDEERVKFIDGNIFAVTNHEQLVLMFENPQGKVDMTSKALKSVIKESFPELWPQIKNLKNDFPLVIAKEMFTFMSNNDLLED